MGTIPLPITADQARRGAQAMIHEMNQMRTIPKLPASVQRIADENTVHIFNVGPWPHTRELGSINCMVGARFIPKCEKGQEYAAAVPIPGIIAEPVPIDEKHMELRQEEGRYVAEQILGVGKHLDPRNSLVKYGVFIAEGKVPTKAELKEARKNLFAYYQELVAEARTAYATGPKEAEATIRPSLHHVAARELNLNDEPWLVNAMPEGRQTCPSCGVKCDHQVILCHNCKYIFKPEEYAKLAERFAK